MWMMRRKSAEELDSILYFLSNALTSVIDDSSYLADHGAMMPQIGAGLATAEIASRLAMFREQVCDVSERECMVVTKLHRARHWAQELRRHEPHLRADIDAFLSATAPCDAMVRSRGVDAQSVFDGQAQPKRFLADRMPTGRVAAEAALSLMERLDQAECGEDVSDDDGPSYLIGGVLSVEALNEACERLLERLSAHYGWEGDSETLAAEEEAPLETDGEQPGAQAGSDADSAEAEAEGSEAEAEGGDEARKVETPAEAESSATQQATAEAEPESAPKDAAAEVTEPEPASRAPDETTNETGSEAPEADDSAAADSTCGRVSEEPAAASAKTQAGQTGTAPATPG